MTTPKIKSTNLHLQHQVDIQEQGKDDGRDFFSKSSSECTPFFSPSTMQPKLTIGQPNDKYEKEADATADKVVQKVAGSNQNSSTTVSADSLITPSPLQAKEEEPKEEEQQDVMTKLQNKSIAAGSEAPPEEENNDDVVIDLKAGNKSPLSAASNFENRLLNSNQGTALADETQQNMEAAFAADFANVRIHKDGEAAQLSQDIGARAFTHGADIYFNEGEFDIQSKEGIHLLAHELTHTLQQGASDGVSTKVQQKELIQAAPAAKVVIDEDFIFQAHSLQTDGSAVIKAVRKWTFPGYSGISGGVDKIKTITNKAERDIIFDLSKHHGAYNFAKELSAHWNGYLPEKTAFFDQQFYEDVLKGDLSWLPTHPVLNKYFTWRFLDTFRIYFYRPFVYRQSLKDKKKLETLFEEFKKWKDSPSGLQANERQYYTLRAFFDLEDGYRRKMFQRVDKIYGKQIHVGHKRNAINAIKQNAESNSSRISALKTKSEFEHLLGIVAPKIVVLADEALAFLDQTTEDFDSSLKVAVSLKDEYFKKYDKKLVAIVKLVFKLNYKGEFLAATAYKRQLQIAIENIKKEIAHKESARLVNLQRKAATKDNLEARTISVFLYIMRAAVEVLAEQKHTLDDNAAVNELTIMRIKLANQLWKVGDNLGFTNLKNGMDMVAFPTDKAFSGGIQKRTFLAFEEGNIIWDPFKGGIDELLAKFTGEFDELDGSAAAAVVMKRFFKGEYLHYYNALLIEATDREGAQYNFGSKLKDYDKILNKVHKKIKGSLNDQSSILPQRVVMKGTYFSAVDGANFGPFVQQDEQFKKHFFNKFRGFINYVPYPVNVHHKEKGIVVWAISDEVFENMANELKLLFPHQPTAQLTGFDWWVKFAERLAKLDKTEQDKVTAKAKDEFVSPREKQNKNLIRRAYSHHRRVLLTSKLIPLWKNYDGLSRTGTYGDSEKATRWLEGMAVNAQPEGVFDRQLQMTAALLEMAKLITNLTNDLYSDTRRGVFRDLIAHVKGAIKRTDWVLNHWDELDMAYHKSEHAGKVELLKKWFARGDKEIKANRRKSRFRGHKGKQQLTYTGDDPWKKDQNIIHSGKVFTLKEVYEDFVFEEPMVHKTNRRIWSEETIESIYASRIYIKKGSRWEEIPWNARGHVKLYSFLELPMEIVEGAKINDHPTIVKDDNDAQLTKTSVMIINEDFRKSMEALASVLNTFGEWMTTPLYFIPGLGQAVLAGEMVIGVLQFMTSQEFLALKKALGADGQEMIKKGWEDVKEKIFEPEKLLELLLLSDMKIPTISPREPKSKPRGGTKKTGVLKKIGRLGVMLANGFGRFKNFISRQIQKVRSFVLKSPTLTKAIRFLENNFWSIKAKVTSGASIFKNAKSEVSQFSGNIQENILGNLDKIEVPETLVPINPIVDFAIQGAIKIVARGPKKIAAKFLMEGLRAAGLYDKIVDYVANNLKGSGIDPNVYLVGFVQKEIVPTIKKAGDDFAQSIGDVMDAVPELRGIKPEMPDIKSLAISDNLDEEGDRDVQPFAEHKSVFEEPLPDLPLGGKPFDDKQQADFSARLGQDFSHVRIHDDATSNQIVGDVGAEALTSGSHVYLKSGLNISSGRGQHIVQHELGHVVQQTGSRPAGAEHSSSSVDGKNKKKINYDPALESDADRFAATSSESTRNTSQNTEGVQPRLEDLTLRFMEDVSTAPEAKDFIVQISKNARLTDPEKRLGTGLFAKLHEVVNTTSNNKFKVVGKFAPVKDDLRKYLKRRFNEDKLPATQVKNLISNSKFSKKMSGSDKKKWFLDVPRLEIGLEEWIVSNGGVFLDIEFNTQSKGVINASDPIKFIKVKNVFMDKVNASGVLWDKAVENTYNHPRYKVNTQYTTAQKGEYIKKTKHVLKNTNYIDPWGRGEFRFNDNIVALTEQWIHPNTTDLKTGDANEPIPIYWYKKPSDYRRSIQLTAPTNRVITIGNTSYKPEYRGTPIQIGVNDEYMVKKGRVLQRIKSAGRNESAATYRAALKSFGYTKELEGLDIDHVTDLAFSGHLGGPKAVDTFENLWPLKSGINRIPFNKQWLDRYKIVYEKNGKAEFGTLRSMYGKHFEIIGFKNWIPKNPGGLPHGRLK